MHPCPVTWSSSGSSPKAGIYFAHSTNTNNCCLIESQTSPTVADFCSGMSGIPTGAVIWRETENKGFLGYSSPVFIVLLQTAAHIQTYHWRIREERVWPVLTAFLLGPVQWWGASLGSQGYFFGSWSDPSHSVQLAYNGQLRLLCVCGKTNRKSNRKRSRKHPLQFTSIRKCFSQCSKNEILHANCVCS